MLVNIHKQTFLSVTVTVWLFSASVQGQPQAYSLRQCIDSALERNKNLEISRNNIRLSEERHKEVSTNLLPKVSINSDYKYYIEQPTQLVPMSMLGGPEGKYKAVQMGTPHNVTVNVQATLPVFNPQILGNMRTTEIATELNELQHKKNEEQIHYEISNLYYNAQIMEKQIAYVDSNLVNSRKLHKNINILYEQLMVKKSDADKIALDIMQLETQRETLQNKLDQVLNSLKFMMGISLETDLQVEKEIRLTAETGYTSRNPVDVQLLRTQNRLLTSELKTLRNSRLPSLALFGSYGRSGYGYDKKPDNFLDFYGIALVGIQLNIPLFNGTTTQKKINQKRIEMNNNELQSALLHEQIDIQTRNARNQKTTALKNVSTSSEQIKLSQRVYDQTVLQQQEGTATLTDVLMADNALRTSQQNYLAAVVDFLKADLELKKLTGNITN